MESPSSTSVPPLMKDEEPRNWVDLPTDLTSLILQRLSVTEILDNAQKVCRSWRHVCKDPSMWRKIDMENVSHFKPMVNDVEVICRHAVDRSQGGLLEINIGDFGSDSLLTYIAERSSNLKSLGLAMCSEITEEGFVQAVVKLPMLEELEVSGMLLSGESLKLAGLSCPNLKSLKLNRLIYLSSTDDVNAIAIAESMPKLRHLQLCGQTLTKTGLNAILDNCPHMEHLDLRQCFNLNLVGNLEKRFKDLRLSNDSTAYDPFGYATIIFHLPHQLTLLKEGDD
ncbi:F-box-like domain superfamily [Arabidopsis suecica]|uniref:F-box-like domain superfamily n=1 Tax=Arabidopsis suecica TaxID=45249 RepID=A0A8T1XRX5_ARASU|nr:F-box-like domain superfamily [Arabidopsis suecica]